MENLPWNVFSVWKEKGRASFVQGERMDHKEAEWRGWESGEGFMRVGVVEGKKEKERSLCKD